ncbi:hypothetical protein SARI_02584 [Salmonella enterica subsp. arizonae serovar 62:z4,z23:-]|uniref:Uncharacterized protein n=1 Tax=Salmonella arizonae (strain ATCC BAA-731 / CDC346-86 / RSK2980) TaxID=41514 RepID=A9MMW5_SALAR|nr:hypothetical protein SARI_02584 [Salmonella enterica subsp. arizonae serovar 62:z4,z23:-]
MHQAAGGIIDKYKQAAFWRTTFKPVMMGAVDLDQFTQTITTMSGLINP